MIPDWISDNESLLWWMGAASVLTLLVSAIAIPWVVARLPADYLVSNDDGSAHQARRHPSLRMLLLILKNLFGGLLILAGLIMLLTPGQGLLSIFVGLTLINFPGRRRLLRSLLRRPSIHRPANWVREKCNVPPLDLPE